MVMIQVLADVRIYCNDVRGDGAMEGCEEDYKGIVLEVKGPIVRVWVTEG